MSKYKYGWRPSKPHSAKKYSVCHTTMPTLPPLVDLRPVDCPIYDQTTLGSCTANGTGAAIQFIQKNLTPSRLYIYWNERNIEGTVNQDAGGEIHDAIQSVVKYGVCSENLWPYDVNQFAVKPPQACYDAAKLDFVTDYFELETLEDIKQCLSAGFPVVFGITLYESFESDDVARTGLVPIPKPWEEVIGGHCMEIVGYDENKQIFIVRNSWGKSWAVDGYCYVPYQMIQDFASDFWTIRKDSAI